MISMFMRNLINPRNKHFSEGLFIAIILLVMLDSCRTKGVNDDVLKDILAMHKSDTLIADIPLERNGKPRYDYTRAREFEIFLGLNDISKGVNSFELRVWYGFSSDTSQLVIIKHLHGSWLSELIAYRIYRERIEDSFRVEKIVEQQVPVNGWTNFINRMKDYYIINLPDSRAFENYQYATDGQSVKFEVASNNYYRIYSYPAPDVNRTLFKEIDTAMRFLDFIEEELKFERVIKY